MRAQRPYRRGRTQGRGQAGQVSAGPTATDGVETCTIIGLAVTAERDQQRFLTRDERTRRHELPESRQAQWLAARVALKLAYRTCLGLQVPLEAVETWNDRLGRPHVGAPGGWHCSVSHTVGWALAAVSATPVGIDVESLREVDPGAIRLVAAPDEWGVVEGSTPPEAAALRLWTVKEAVLKGLGTGFRLEPRSVRVVAASEQSAHVDVAGEGDSSSRHWRVSSEILEDRVVSIAHVRSHLCSARIRWIDGIGVSAALDAT